MALSAIGQSKGNFIKLDRKFKLGGVYDIIAKYGNLFIDKMKDNLERQNSNASHKLSQSIRFEIKILGDLYRFQIFLEDYWEYVDKGVKGTKTGLFAPNSPFQYKEGKLPPIVQIEKWITQKGIKVSLTKKGNETIKKLKNKTVKKSLRQLSIEKQRRSMAIAIAKNINKRGIAATNFYSDVINEASIERFKKDLVKELKRDVIVELREIKKEINGNNT